MANVESTRCFTGKLEGAIATGTGLEVNPGTGELFAVTGGSSNFVGVLLHQPGSADLGDAVVCFTGGTKMRAGAAVANPGILLECDASGRAVTATGAANTFGMSLEPMLEVDALYDVLIFDSYV